jgi:hypothetical protein
MQAETRWRFRSILFGLCLAPTILDRRSHCLRMIVLLLAAMCIDPVPVLLVLQCCSDSMVSSLGKAGAQSTTNQHSLQDHFRHCMTDMACAPRFPISHNSSFMRSARSNSSSSGGLPSLPSHGSAAKQAHVERTGSWWAWQQGELSVASREKMQPCRPPVVRRVGNASPCTGWTLSLPCSMQHRPHQAH